MLKRSWGGEIKNVSALAAIGVGGDGFRRILGVVEGHKEDKAGWLGFLKHLKSRGLSGAQLVISEDILFPKYLSAWACQHTPCTSG